MTKGDREISPLPPPRKAKVSGTKFAYLNLPPNRPLGQPAGKLIDAEVTEFERLVSARVLDFAELFAAAG